MNLGNPAENRTARILEGHGYLVASRRHVGGAGDLVAVERTTRHERAGERGLLVEVKRGTGNLWEHFRKGDRVAMTETAWLHDLEPLLAYWPWHPGPDKHPVWLPAEDWPA